MHVEEQFTTIHNYIDTETMILRKGAVSAKREKMPMAYKKMEDIVNNIGETAEMIHIIKPIYNFKAGEE